ncbi:pilus (MSHA type) biogenesis protein MshL [Marinimicrobium alkaliphilum]|uniref:pilus (MSHA type) biogenesis protein MshL n=1 Tax=Marinimicrobium alkaliphilum TaxID=2202654 RepID=UPI001E3F1AA0|nr:pilus (MSHA type) biogenesis protein MshL [Marinimicrobium alkaliphilum]
MPDLIMHMRRRLPALSAATLALLVNACASVPEQSDEPTAAELVMEQLAQEQRERGRQLPDDVAQALLVPPRAAASREQERFDISVNNVPARSFFLGLVDGTDTNIVVHPDVAGTVTLDLKRVTVDEVLQVIRDIYGYEYQRSGNGIYTIYPRELRTQTFQINYLDVQRVGVSDTNLSIGRQHTSGGGNRFSGGGQGGGSGSEGADLLSMLGGESLGGGSEISPGARVQTLNRTDFWQSLKQTVGAIIGGESGERMVMVTPQAGMLVVKAMPHELNAVRDFLERSELSVKRQVILEAKIVEVRLSDGYEAGINWGAISGELAQTYQRGRTTGTNENFQTSQNIPGGAASGALTFSDTVTTGSENMFSAILQVGDITDLLSLLESQGHVQVLSSPRVSTVNNQKALIRVGSDEYFITGITSNTTANVASVTSAPNIELSSFFSGIALDVTPQIGSDGDVILHIHPVVSEVTDQLKVFTIGDEQFSLPLAQRGVRESDSIVRARSGQVVILGGLMQENARTTEEKVPVLGDIPVVRGLFRRNVQSTEKTELVIMLRPVVVDEDTWQEELDRGRQRMREMGEAQRNRNF